MISQRNVMMSMVQAAIVAGLEPPKPILEVRVRSAQVRWLLIPVTEIPTRHPRLPAHLSQLWSALRCPEAGVAGHTGRLDT